jgi:hypothetical protein
MLSQILRYMLGRFLPDLIITPAIYKVLRGNRRNILISRTRRSNPPVEAMEAMEAAQTVLLINVGNRRKGRIVKNRDMIKQFRQLRANYILLFQAMSTANHCFVLVFVCWMVTSHGHQCMLHRSRLRLRPKCAVLS